MHDKAAGKLPFVVSALTVTFFFYISFFFFLFLLLRISCMLHPLLLPVLLSVELSYWHHVWFFGSQDWTAGVTQILFLCGCSLCGRGISSLKRTFFIPLFSISLSLSVLIKWIVWYTSSKKLFQSPLTEWTVMPNQQQQ